MTNDRVRQYPQLSAVGQYRPTRRVRHGCGFDRTRLHVGRAGAKRRECDSESENPESRRRGAPEFHGRFCSGTTRASAFTVTLMANASAACGGVSKYRALRPEMDERMRRHWAAAEARELGWGGITAVSEATGLSRVTITAGLRELEQPARVRAREAERVRRGWP